VSFDALRNLGDCLAATGDDWPALIEVGETSKPRKFTYNELNGQANAVARGLLKRGLSRGDRVAILAANRAEFVTAYFGIMRAGLVCVPINFRLPKRTIEGILRDSGCKLVFCDGERRDASINELPVVDFDASDVGFGGLLDLGDFDSYVPKPDDLALLLYTSGSKGHPKGVKLTHGGMLWAAGRRTGGGTRRPGVRSLIVAPLYHMNGLTNTTLQCLVRGSFVMLRRFDSRQYLTVIQDYRCTSLGAIPAMMAMAAREEDLLNQLDLASVQQVMLGSAPCSVPLLDRTKLMFPRASVVLGYGATETGPCVFGPHPEKPLPALSIGYPYPGVEVRLVGTADPDIGELEVRSPAVSPGYLNLPEETRERFRNGWYSTGDIMRRDDDGFYYFVSRADDMFVCAGENIYPSEAEATLEKHPGIHQAAVVPLDDEIKGQVPVAFVVPRNGALLSEQEVKQFALHHGPAYQHPRHVAFLEELPLAGTNKVDRRALIEKAKAIWMD
jgi:long-chain acyl-CoA synthetase